MNGQYQRQQHGRNQNRQGNKNSGHGGDDSLPAFQSKWITEGADDKMIEYAKKLAHFMVDSKKDGEKVSSSQLRNIYGEVMRIKQKGFNKGKTDFLLLKPKVAYNYGRIKNSQQKERFKVFLNDFNKAHALVESEKTFDNFHKYFEAILAYHKYYGGK